MGSRGGMIIELIEPVAGEVGFYRRLLPDDGSFAVRLHHVATFIESGDEEWERLRALLAASGLRVDYTVLIPTRPRRLRRHDRRARPLPRDLPASAAGHRRSSARWPPTAPRRFDLAPRSGRRASRRPMRLLPAGRFEIVRPISRLGVHGAPAPIHAWGAETPIPLFGVVVTPQPLDRRLTRNEGRHATPLRIRAPLFAHHVLGFGGFGRRALGDVGTAGCQRWGRLGHRRDALAGVRGRFSTDPGNNSGSAGWGDMAGASRPDPTSSR